MAARHFPETPLQELQGMAAEVSTDPTTKLERRLLRAMSGLSRQLTQVLQSTIELKQEMADVKARLASLEAAALEPRAKDGGSSRIKGRRRAHNPRIAQTVRRLHNSEGNTKQYDPEQGLSSPHNESVTAHLVEALAACRDMKGVDTGVLTSACKTYYETVRRNFRFSQPDLADHAVAVKNAAKNRQRRKRLLEARRAVLTKEEIDFWKGVTTDMMSDEEDGTSNGIAGWIVRPPSFRSKELSDLCTTLQERLNSDPKYIERSSRRLLIGSPSERTAPTRYDPEAAKRHLKN